MNNEERTLHVRHLEQQAIHFAQESKWDEAAEANRELLRLVQRNPSTLNRLGKALSELGQYGEAKRAYSEALQLDPTNMIARKNLDRLSQLSDEVAPEGHTTEKVDPKLFIEEIGKTGVTSLVNLAQLEVLARMTAGDQVYLNVDGHALFIKNKRGEIIGQVEPVLANRLIKFINGGNQYAAAITELNEGSVRVIIRETFQHASMLGKVSFPALGAGSLPRADIRDTLVRDHDEDVDYDEDSDDEYDEVDDEEIDEDDDLADIADDTETGDVE
jgi:tetratricopeptide (TPR) repeat protein